MSDLRVVAWFSWFLVSNWFAHLNLISKLQFLKRGSLMHKKVALLLAVFLALGIFLGTSRAASAQEDPPTRVARLNFIEGSVSYQPGGDDDQEWVAADRNRPLTTGDDLWSDQASRGEIHIGSTAIRLGPQTGISFLNLDDNTIQVQLTQGVIEVHIRHYNPDNAYEIDTPNLAFTIYAPGKYRIQTDPDGYSTMILVRDGQGQATGAGQTFDINPQQAYTFSGGEQLTYDVQPAGGPDEFEHWSESRDLREDAPPPLVTFRPIWMATTTSMTMATGRTIPNMARSGSRATSHRGGLRITMATGSGSLPGDGLGLTRNRGASLRFTTDVGRKCAAAIGDGCLVLRLCVPCTHRRSLPLSAEVPASAPPSASAADSPGSRCFRLARATDSLLRLAT